MKQRIRSWESSKYAMLKRNYWILHIIKCVILLKLSILWDKNGGMFICTMADTGWLWYPALNFSHELRQCWCMTHRPSIFRLGGSFLMLQCVLHDIAMHSGTYWRHTWLPVTSCRLAWGAAQTVRNAGLKGDIGKDALWDDGFTWGLLLCWMFIRGCVYFCSARK